MRQKFIFTTAAALCLVLAFGVALASERERDTSADRSKRGATGANVGLNQDAETPQVYGTRTVTAWRQAPGNGAQKARALYLAAAGKEGNEAVQMLQQILTFELPDTPETDKLLSGVHEALANHYGHAPAKQVHFLAIAMQYTADPAKRARIETRIVELGGDAVAFAFDADTSDVTAPNLFGVADTCDLAQATGLGGAGSLFTDTLTIEPFGDHDWYVVDVAGAGSVLRIETFTDTPGTFLDDSDLTLYDGCAGGVPGNLLFFDDDGGGNGFFTSRIDTNCLGTGTYYLEVGGFADTSGADNIDLEIEVVADCVPPTPDSFEPDNDNANASKIGHKSSNSNPNTNLTGRVRKEIQAHNFLPAPDVDVVKFALNKSQQVRMQTAACFPTIFNGYDCSGAEGHGNNPDTVMTLLFGTEADYGGLCNQADIGFGPACLNDLGCDIDGDGLIFPDDDDLAGPIISFPACIPWINFINAPFGPENPLAFNDDSAANQLGSDLTLCLPRTLNNGPSAAVEILPGDHDWFVRVEPFSASDEFDYSIWVHNQANCRFELEPNDTLSERPKEAGTGTQGRGHTESNSLTLGTRHSGFFDYSARIPFQDEDYLWFDVDEEVAVRFTTDGWDTFAVDTAIELYVGPDAAGAFFFTGVRNDDYLAGNFLSQIEVVLPPACELLSSCGEADTQYALNVTSDFLNPNYPWDLNTEIFDPSTPEPGDWTDCGDGGEAPASVGESFISTIDNSAVPPCDFDGYKFSLGAASNIEITTSGSGDTTIQLVDCNSMANLACDDDGGAGLLSLVAGCLPAGDYCVRVRAFSGFDTFDYGLSIVDAGGGVCTPGALTFDGLFTCGDFPGSVLFDTCP